MTRVAAVDCGTNTLRLLIADLDPVTGTEHELVREMRVVRLGQDVDRTGRLADEALERVFNAVDAYAATIGQASVDVVRVCATSAARDAANAEVFIAGIKERLGVVPDVITGAAEAQLTFAGATRSLPGDLHGPVMVVDIGGGSTELIIGDIDGTVSAAHSLDIGSVRMTERHLRSDPPSTDEVASMTAEIEGALDELETHGVHIENANTLVGVAGTITTVAAAILELEEYDRTRIHHATLPRAEVRRISRRLLGLTVEERRALPFMHPGRADVIGAGALILSRIAVRASVDELLISEADILDGIAWSVA